jgi:SAM-dependent methyltransferase
LHRNAEPIMNDPRHAGTWTAGDLYEPYVGRWSRLVAREFLGWLAVPAQKEWLDVGCGTGALTRTILDLAAPLHVHGVDPSRAFVDYASAHIVDQRVSFAVGDAQTLPEVDQTFDAAVSALVLNFVPEPRRAVAEMARAVRRGGVVAAYVWDYAGKMELMRYFWDAVVALHPDAAALDEGRRFPLCQPAPLRALFEAARIEDLEVRAIEVPTVFRDFADYWTPFLGGQGPAPGYLATLDPAHRGALRDSVHARLPIAADGTIALVARAWAVRGRSPAHGG